MKNTNQLTVGQRVRLSGTLMYGTVSFIFDDKTVYLLIDHFGETMEVKYGIKDVSLPIGESLKQKIEKAKDLTMIFFSEKVEIKIRKFLLYFFAILMLYNIFALLFN